PCPYRSFMKIAIIYSLMSSIQNCDRLKPVLGELYLRSPTVFINQNWAELLPDWSNSPQTLIIICLRANHNLKLEGKAIADEKDRLFDAFQEVAKVIESLAQQNGILIESICPKSGFPNHTQAGHLVFDLVNILHECLVFNFKRTEKGCKILSHPQWQQAIYPGLLISDLERDRVAPLVYNTLSNPRIEKWSKLTIITSN
ncbi:MAG: hypothetical protein ACRC6M_18380, partial [Microcystaceae cyanobacterium]